MVLANLDTKDLNKNQGILEMILSYYYTNTYLCVCKNNNNNNSCSHFLLRSVSNGSHVELD